MSTEEFGGLRVRVVEDTVLLSVESGDTVRGIALPMHEAYALGDHLQELYVQWQREKLRGEEP